jgi:hypothetical protein
MLDMMRRKRVEFIFFQEVKYRLTEKLENHAYVISKIKPFKQMNAFAKEKVYLSIATHECARADLVGLSYFRFSGSFSFNVLRTRISILLASLYFGTARMTLTAQYRRRTRSQHSTTLPNVPWPSKRIILSKY